MKKLLLALAVVGATLFTACNKDQNCGHEFVEYDYSEALVGTWTCLEENQSEAMVINPDGSFAITGVMKGGALYEENGTIKVVNNKVSLTYNSGDVFEGRLELVAGKSLSIVLNEEYDIRLTYDYCANDLADEIIGMWVCNDGPMAGGDDMTIQTFNADGTSIVTGVGPSGDKGGQITYKVVGDLLFNIMPKQLADGVSRYSCSRIVYTPNGTALGDVMSHTSYYAVGENFDIVKSTVTWLRVKQSLDLASQKYDYNNVYVSNVKGEDKDIPFFDTTINFAKLDNSLMNNFLSATLFSVEFPDANTMKYSFLLANNITTYPPTSIEVEGNKMTIKMSANNSVYKDVELYAFQDKDNSQLHMYMPTKSFENFLGNMRVNIMVEKGQLDLTDAVAVKAVYDNIESAIETINVSLVMSK